MRIRFTAGTMTEYHSLELNCIAPGVYEVSEEKAAQVLRDFPRDFEKEVPDQPKTKQKKK